MHHRKAKLAFFEGFISMASKCIEVNESDLHHNVLKFAFMQVFKKFDGTQKIEFLLKFCPSEYDNSKTQSTAYASRMTAIDDIG